MPEILAPDPTSLAPDPTSEELRCTKCGSMVFHYIETNRTVIDLTGRQPDLTGQNDPCYPEIRCVRCSKKVIQDLENLIKKTEPYQRVAQS